LTSKLRSTIVSTMIKDATVYNLVKKERHRQQYGIELIPSENYASPHVLKILSSPFGNKYSEGYPKARYYGGNENADELEIVARERAKTLFKVPHANVQPYSGSPANFAVYLATCQPGDVIMGLNLTDGGHLTHGWKVSATAIFYKSIPYHVTKDGRIDFEEVRRLAKQHKPKLIWAGATAYVYKYDYEKFARIAEEIGAYFAADIAHVAGLIVGKVHPSPVKHAHIVTTTTHKTLRGPRGGMIMVTQKGLEKDPELAKKIDRAVFPGLQGGPHDHQTGAIAVALFEASQQSFIKYSENIIRNAQVLAQSLIDGGLKLVGNGTENHMMLIDLIPVFGPGGGVFVEKALDMVGLTLNKNTIPGEPSSPFYPSGVRLGSPAATTRGMGPKEMKLIGRVICNVIDLIKDCRLPDKKEDRSKYIHSFVLKISSDKRIKKLHKDVIDLAKRFPLA